MQHLEVNKIFIQQMYSEKHIIISFQEDDHDNIMQIWKERLFKVFNI